MALAGPTEQVFGTDAYQLSGGEGGPILVVRGPDAEPFAFEQGDLTKVEGTVEEELDAAALAEDLSEDFDPATLEEFEGEPYVLATTAEPAAG